MQSPVYAEIPSIKSAHNSLGRQIMDQRKDFLIVKNVPDCLNLSSKYSKILWTVRMLSRA